MGQGQFHDTAMSTRTIFDEKSENGLVLSGTYLPEELLAAIFCYLDLKSLLNCQLVCKRWKNLILSYVWRKKTEITLGQPLLLGQDVPWHTYYLICKKRPFERNLIKNHSGEHGIQKHWRIVDSNGDRWKVECPPEGTPPLPSDEPVFEGQQYCFVTSYQICNKKQIIDLEAEGLTPNILDNLQPPIVVSEWHSCRWDCPAVYECTVKLVGKDNKELDCFNYVDSIEGVKQNQWHKVSHEFRNYGPGLAKISFHHGGIDQSYWAGHYGSKMAGACVCVKIPTAKRSQNEEQDALLNAE